jgi:hypothetical protein
MNSSNARTFQDAQRRAAKLLSGCAPEARVRFEQLYKEALAAALTTAHEDGGDVDPYVVERNVIATLRARSLGDNEDGTPGSGIGWVPIPRGGLAQIPDARARLAAHRTNPQRNAAPGATATPSADDPDAARERRMRFVGLGVVALMVLWLVLRATHGAAAPATQNAAGASPSPSGSSIVTGAAAGGAIWQAGAPSVQGDPSTSGATGAAASARAAVADVRVRGAELLYPTSLEIQPPEGESVVLRVVPSSSELGGTWAPQIAPGTAAWLTGSTINPVVCLPSDAAGQLEALPRGTPIRMRLVSSAMRRYEVLTVERVGRWQTELLAQQRAGLTIIACGMEGDERVVVQALYRPDDDTVLQPRYISVELAPFARLDLRAIAREETTSGTEVVRVDVNVTNTGTTELALRDLEDHLMVDNQPLDALAHTERGGVLAAGQARIVTFRYRIPDDAPALADAVWRVVAPTGAHGDVAIVIPPPDEDAP